MSHDTKPDPALSGQKSKIPIWRFIFAVVLLGLLIYFLRSSRVEFVGLGKTLREINLWYLLIGVILSILFVLTHAAVLSCAYKVRNCPTRYLSVVKVILKRFFISSFIPVGFSASQYTFTSDLSSEDVSRIDSYMASTIYILVGCFSYFVVFGLGLVFFLQNFATLPYAKIVFAIFIIYLVSCIYLAVEFKSFSRGEGLVFKLIHRFYPPLEELFAEGKKKHLVYKYIYQAVAWAFLLDILGGLFVWIAMLSVNYPITYGQSLLAYLFNIALLTVSPMFQGLVLVDVSMAALINQYGVVFSVALAGTLVARFYQVWLPFLAGGVILARDLIKKLLRSRSQ